MDLNQSRVRKVEFKDIHDHRAMSYNRGMILREKQQTCKSCEIEFYTTGAYLMHVTMWLSQNDPHAKEITSSSCDDENMKNRRRRRRSLPPSPKQLKDQGHRRVHRHASQQPLKNTTPRGSL